MSKIVKVIPLFNAITGTTASTSYVAISAQPIVYWDNDAYDGTVEVYFEAVLSTTSGGTAYAQAYTNAGSAVTGAEVTTTSTTATRVRSGDIKSNLSDNTDYVFRIKASSGATTTVHTARLIVVQSGIVTKTETQISLAGQYASTTSTSVVDRGYTYLFYYDSAQFDGTVTIYLESTGARTGFGSNYHFTFLYDTSNNFVSDSTLTFSSTTYYRARSSAITLSSGTTYKIRFRTTNFFNTAQSGDVRLIVQQSNFTKTETHYTIRTSEQTDTTTAGSNLNGYIYWDNDEWSVVKNTIYYESTLSISDGTKTAYLDLNDGTSDLVTNSTSSTSKTRVRSSAITPSDNTTYDAQLSISATTATATSNGPRLIVQSIITNPYGNPPFYGMNF